MLRPLNQSKEINNFSEIILNAFKGSFSSLLGKSFEFKIGSISEGELNDIALEYMGQTMINIKESLNVVEGGILIDTVSITGLADLMLMGSGEGVSELNDDLKDAVKELINQTISSINIPFNEKFNKKVAFGVISVDTLLDTSSYSGNIMIFDIHCSYEGKEINFKLFFSSKLKDLIMSQNDLDDDFDFSPEVTAVNPMPKQQKHSGGNNIDLLLDVEVPVSIKIGSTRMFLKDIVSLSPGNIVELDEYAEEPVVVMVNNKPIAKGEVVIVDGYFGVRIKEIISKEERIKKLRD